MANIESARQLAHGIHGNGGRSDLATARENWTQGIRSVELSNALATEI